MDDIRKSTLEAESVRQRSNGNRIAAVHRALEPFGQHDQLGEGAHRLRVARFARKKEERRRENTPTRLGAALVGCVTAQHVGRLRRAYLRFGKDYQTYDGLYWSHFQAAVDWDDAEMYLEGAVREGWSVSQMRRTRWEAMGAVASQKPRDEDIVSADLDEDFEPGENSPPESDTLSTSYGEVTDPRSSEEKGSADEKAAKAGDRVDEVAAQVDESPRAEVQPVRPFEEIGELPEDVAGAFEQMKLAILRHKADDWREIARDEMLAVLDSLKELALAPSVEGTPF